MAKSTAAKIVELASKKIAALSGEIAALTQQLADAKAQPPVGAEELAAALAAAAEAQAKYDALVQAETAEDVEDAEILANFEEFVGGDPVSPVAAPVEVAPLAD
jgi:hypothetical protein